jgi:deoxycytidylate deaminase
MVKHEKHINNLFILAQTVEPVAGARMSAAVVHKKRIVGYGFNQNKTHPIQNKFNKHEEANFLHAEISAIINALRNVPVDLLPKCTLYVARARRGCKKGPWEYGLAKPCKGCQKYIDSFGIKKVVYTNNVRGFSSLF